MAKVTMTFEDKEGGGVSVVADPSFEVLMAMHMSGHEWTSAQSYAIYAINKIREESKAQTPTRILIPRIGY